MGRINGALKELMEKGEIDKLYARWFKQGNNQRLNVQPLVK